MNNNQAMYLDPDEEILWQGQPDHRLFLIGGEDFLLIPFSVIWMSATIWGLGVTAAQPTGFPTTMMILLFFFVGVYLTIGRYIFDAQARRRTLYAVTNKKAYILELSRQRRLQVLPIRPNTPVELFEGHLGFVRLGRGPEPNNPTISLWFGGDGTFSFRALDDPRTVYSIIKKIQAEQGVG
ncbi:MAG: hypothetical protein AAGE89_07540 [Pseudomonadota bacterium]